MGSLIMNESNFQHILRVLNTNLDGKVKVMFALTSIKGVGRRFSNVCCKKAEVDLTKRCAFARPRPELLGVHENGLLAVLGAPSSMVLGTDVCRRPWVSGRAS